MLSFPSFGRQVRKRLDGGSFEVGFDLFVHSLPVAPPLRLIDLLGCVGELSDLLWFFLFGFDRTELGHWFSVFRNDDGFTVRGVVHQTRKLRLGFVEINLPAHSPTVSHDLVKQLVKTRH